MGNKLSSVKDFLFRIFSFNVGSELNDQVDVIDTDEEIRRIPFVSLSEVKANCRTGDLLLWARYEKANDMTFLQRITMMYTKSYVTHVAMIYRQNDNLPVQTVSFDLPGMVWHPLSALPRVNSNGFLNYSDQDVIGIHTSYEIIWLRRNTPGPVPNLEGLDQFLNESKDKKYEFNFIELWRSKDNGNLYENTDRMFCSEFCQEALKACEVLSKNQRQANLSNNTLPHEFMDNDSFEWSAGESGFSDPLRVSYNCVNAETR